MSNVIPQMIVRNLALKADSAIGDGDHVKAMIVLVDAWEKLFGPQSPTKASDDSSPLRFGPQVSRPLDERKIAGYLYNESGSRRYSRVNEDLGRQIATITNVVTALQEAAWLTAVGVDYASYQGFRALTPRRNDYMGGKREYRAPATYDPPATMSHSAFTSLLQQPWGWLTRRRN